MTKKDYELIAECILQVSGQVSFGTEQQICDRIAESLANAMQSKNTLFNRSKFLKACGMKREQGNENITCNYCAGMTEKEREQEQHECYETR